MIAGILAGGSKKILKNLKPLLLVGSLAALLSGCAGKMGPVGPVFFPPPPEEPHVQYLTGVTNSGDVKEASGGLTKLLVGSTETITKLAKPYGVVLHKKKLYICDVGGSQVVVIDFLNKNMYNHVNEIGPGRLSKPISVAVDQDDYVYVADNGRKDIAVYDPKGKFVRSINNGFTGIIGVGIDGDYLFALDNKVGKVFVMDRKTGDQVAVIGASDDRSKNLSMPNGMTVDPKGFLHVVNVGNGKVKEYDRDGNLRSSFGKLGDFPGEFTRPRGIAVDEDGQVFVVDAGHQVVQVFNEKKRILGDFGAPGLMAGSTNLPAGVAVTKDKELLDYFQKYAAPNFKLSELVFVTNQYHSEINHSLAVYGLGEFPGAKEREAEADRIREQNKARAKGNKKAPAK